MADDAKTTDARDRGSLLDRFLRVFSDVRRGEGANAVLLLATIFMLLFCYYVLKTVREPLVLASATADLQLVRTTGLPEWLKQILIEQEGPQLKAFAAGLQAIVLMLYVPAYSWVASRVSRVRLIVGVSIFFIACIQLFFFLRLAGVPMLGFVFFIWVGIFSVSMVAQFWSFANDVYTKDHGERLFPIIGVGATAGAPVGSQAAGAFYDYVAAGGAEGAELDGLQRWLVESDIDPSFILLQVPAVLLAVFTVMRVIVARRFDAPTSSSPAEERPPGSDGKAKGGLGLIFESPYLRLIAAVILILNVVNTLGEFLLSDLVSDAASAAVAAGEASDEGAFIGGFYGDFFTYVNVIALLLQALVVSRLVKHVGIKAVLFALPLVALGSYAMFAAGLGLGALRWAKTAENATDYSIMNTGKAMVWLPTRKAAKYAGKQAVDTFIVRIGDMVSALVFLVATSALHLGLTTLGIINLVLVAGWLGLTFLLVRRNAAVNEDPTIDPATRGATGGAG
ncbi:MAG: NTP/NDP exchange transporter [Sandaracinaceae bacterium]